MDQVQLFPKRHRDDSSPAAHTESTYHFLDRCAKPGCEAIRRLLQRWFGHYPLAHQKALKRRLSADDFHSAFFELLLHEVLRRTECRPEVDPTLASGLKPDFLAVKRDTRFFLEAAVVTDESRDKKKREAVRSAVYDIINEVDSPDYFLGIKECTLKGHAQPPRKAILAFLRAHIGAANYDEVSAAFIEGLDRVTWTYEDDRLTLVVTPVPKAKARGEPGVRPIGIYPMESRWGGSKEAIRKRLSEKAKRYKNLGEQFVIAVNCVSRWGTDWDDIVDALFGSLQVVVDSRTRQAHESRARDGFFIGEKGPQNTRVSAVLVTTVFPWSLAKASVKLILNPWAAYPLTEDVLPFERVSVVAGKFATVAGESLRVVLELTDDWPEGADEIVD